MKDWKQQIVKVLQDRCDQDAGSGLVGPGCMRCQDTFIHIMMIMEDALDDLAAELPGREHDAGYPVAMIAEFKRSLPNG